MKKKLIIAFFTTIVILQSHYDLKAQQAAIFEPGIISLENTWDEYLSFSPDGNTLVITRSGEGLGHKDRRIYFSSKKNSKWTTPVLASFSGDFFDRGASFSPDGNTLFFASNRPGKNGFDYDLDIWFSSKKFDGTWSEASRLGDVINSDEYNETHPYLAKSGNMYFVRYRRGEETDIYVSKWNDNSFQQPKKLNSLINTDKPESHCYIDPDERYMIFTPTDWEDGLGGGDIYISYFKNGSWEKPISMGDKVNSDYYEYSAKLGPDGKLYFSRAGFGQPERKAADIYSIEMKSLSNLE